MALAAGGYGYDSKAAADEALADPKIDSYYRNKLKVIRLKTIEDCPVCGENERPHSHKL